MRLKLQIDDFIDLEIDYPDEESSVLLLETLVRIFRNHGVRVGTALLADRMKQEFEGRPEWKFSKKYSAGEER